MSGVGGKARPAGRASGPSKGKTAGGAPSKSAHPAVPVSLRPIGAGASMNGFHTKCHPACVACRASEDGGLGLRFEDLGDAGVVARFRGDPTYQGYPDRLHGGIVATILDAAMAHCLFARRIRAYTARMELRFRNPIRLGVDAEVRASLVRARPPWYRLRAEVVQQENACADCEAVFLAEETDSAARDA